MECHVVGHCRERSLASVKLKKENIHQHVDLETFVLFQHVGGPNSPVRTSPDPVDPQAGFHAGMGCLGQLVESWTPETKE